MYWNVREIKDRLKNAMLNSNIRCIEMQSSLANLIVTIRWIVTLDVLKCKLKR